VLKIQTRLKTVEEVAKLNEFVKDKEMAAEIALERKEISRLLTELRKKFGVSLFEITGKIGGELLKG